MDLSSLSYEHQIVRLRTASEPKVPRGGILADDMGLGKTLTILSVIIMSLDHARAFARFQGDYKQTTDGRQRVKSTLVVVPSPST